MTQPLLLGFLQGITEWLPVSSEAVIVLVAGHFFETGFFESVRYALFLHLGTVLAAVIYFWHDLVTLVQAIPHWLKSFIQKEEGPTPRHAELNFYAISTILSVIIAALLVVVMKKAGEPSAHSIQISTIVIGALLLGTAFLQWISKKEEQSKQRSELSPLDASIAGIGQGLAALPGVSRSGTTVAFLLLRKLSPALALRASFVMSIPFVIIGNLALNLSGAIWSWEGLLGLAVACVVGLASIHLFLKIVEKFNFAWVVFGFGVVVIVAGVFL